MSDTNNGTPDGAADPNTARELHKARGDLTTLRAELKALRDERDTIRTERDEAIKSRDGYKGQIEKQRGEHEAKVAELTSAASKAKADADEVLASVRTASDRAVIEAEAKAVATSLGAHAPADVVRLLDLSTVTRGEDGTIAGLTEALTAAKEARGYMFGEAPKPGTATGSTQAPAAPRATNPAAFDARTITPAEYEASKAQLLRGARH